jgi:hypothetical protein
MVDHIIAVRMGFAWGHPAIIASWRVCDLLEDDLGVALRNLIPSRRQNVADGLTLLTLHVAPREY